MIETGKVLQQRYRIDKQIGQGGMGAVYVATDERFGSTVAIKETLCMDDNYRKALEREARLLNSLKHAALPRVSDHFLEENGQFLVMEFISGDDLACVMEAENKPFPIDQILLWADQLLDALDFLHNQINPVIHRDIKPQNLKVTPRGQIILLDFGLAKGNVTGAGNQTAAKSIFGYSRNYASLEQIQGTGTDPRSDLYSLAATLYHLATNTPPEDALTRAMAVLNGQPDPLVPANAIEPSIPPGVAAVLHQAMALNASSRPASAAKMREMLRDHESFADYAAAAPVVPAAEGGDLFSQKTKILPGATHQAGERQTHIKTQILPEYISEETKMRDQHGTAAGSRPRRRFGFGAAAATVVLACAAFAAVYVGYPSMFPSDELEQPLPATEAPAVAAPVPEAIVPEAPTSAANAENTVPAETEAAASSRSQSAGRNSRSAPAAKKKTDKPNGGVVSGDTIYVGNMKIHNGVIETPDTYIDENGIRRKVPGTKVQPPPGLPPNFEYLTPDQKQKLIELQKMRMRQQWPANRTVIVPKPSPQ